MAHYERLSFLDTSFLALESRTTHMHVGSVAVFDAAPLKVAGGIDFEKIRDYIHARLHMVDRYRQRLSYIPLEGNPVWIDDDDFHLEYHIRHTSLPHPGTTKQLQALAGRIMSQQLDRTKPLWEAWVVEGLEDDRFAIITKIHHCMIDGIAGVDLMAFMFNLAPDPTIGEIKEWEPRPAPSGAELLVGETARRLRSAIDFVSDHRNLLDETQALAGSVARRAAAVANSLSSGWLKKGAETPVNRHLGPNRRIGWLETDLQTIKDIKNALGGSVNDVVLTLVAGTMRAYLDERGVDPANYDYRVMAPVSVRAESARGSMGNQVAMWLVTLPIGEPDPVQRLMEVRAETTKLKTTDQAMGAATLVQLSSGAPLTLVSLGTRLAADRRPFNMTVTNIPGPQIPLYLADAQLLATYPFVPLWENHGLSMALFSYAGSMAWGLQADWDLVPDMGRVMELIEESIAELARAASASV